MIIISNIGNIIQINYGTHVKNFIKENLHVGVEGNIVYLKDNLFYAKILYSDVITPTFASAVALETQLLLWLNQIPTCCGGGLSVVNDRFDVQIAGINQTVFTPKFQPSKSTGVYVSGYLQIGGWSIVGATVVFTSPVAEGAEIVFENNNNIVIEKTIQVFLAGAGDTTFTTLFTVTSDSLVTVSGLISVYGTDWNIVSGNIVFTTPMSGGEEIVCKK